MTCRWHPTPNVAAAIEGLAAEGLHRAARCCCDCAWRTATTLLLGVWEVVGPICESGDWLGHDRALAPHPGDLLAVLSAGAYCMSMASNYNSRGRAPEVLVDGDQTHLIRRRETIAEQMQQEQLVGG